MQLYCLLQKKKVAIFIDVDLARSNRSNNVRGELYEAAELFRKNGGEIFALSSQSYQYFARGNKFAFTDIYCGPNFSDKDKINKIKNHELWLKHDYTQFIFCDDKLFRELQQFCLPKENIIFNVVGTTFLELYDNHSSTTKYTVVECILFYLSIKLYLNNMEKNVTWE